MSKKRKPKTKKEKNPATSIRSAILALLEEKPGKAYAAGQITKKIGLKKREDIKRAGQILDELEASGTIVRAGDYKTAAAEAEGIWKTWDAGDEQTALIAREFGFASLVAGRNDLARQFGEFLVSEGARLKNPDNQPATSAVLLRVAEFKVKGGEDERKALRDALLARNAAAGVDMTSVLSWEALYLGAWNAADWEGAKEEWHPPRPNSCGGKNP
ncbi:MAG: hypothetical protein HC859_11180 [Bacteroidia bacterium]|nr:hypothetical protein [Bacteroidia bacterium]